MRLKTPQQKKWRKAAQSGILGDVIARREQPAVKSAAGKGKATKSPRAGAGAKAGARRAKAKKIARDYRHGEQALLRPESGSQDVFPQAKRKPPTKLRYDSSLSPELTWDEAEARGEGERLIDRVLAADTLEEAQSAAQDLKRLSKPFLNWAGKAERGGFTVPTLPLFTHERLSTHAVLETLKRRHPNRGATLDLFGESDKSIGDKIRGAYEHQNGWQNRMILGDSLQVMNSLLEYESKAGEVQMVYMDPPYGIKFGSNFQPFVRNKSVKDGEDEAISREPEMVQAYRDTWELGIHSWLTYMRDRLLLARELLADSGSCFVQISDENVHYVREIMDEVFGRDSFVGEIVYKTTSGAKQKASLRRTSDRIIWYAKSIDAMKFNRLFVQSEIDTGLFSRVEDKDGNRRPLTPEEKANPHRLPDGLRPFRSLPLHSQGSGDSDPREFNGQKWTISPDSHWRHTVDGFNRLAEKGRIIQEKTVLGSVYYFDDFAFEELTNNWTDTGPELHKDYVVQTSEKVIQRCMLMTTDPGDLVLDPTCGSGTTAFVAERWGRRWITTDVSRVPVSLARQRLLTAIYPYYQLKEPQRGPAGGFVYKRKQNRKGEEVGGIVPHVTLKSIANDEPPAEEVLVDKPETESDVVRITGPFCVEAVLPTPLSPESEALEIREPSPDEDDHISRMIKVLSLSPELRMPTGGGVGGSTFKLNKVRPPAKSMSLHAEAETAGRDGDERVAVVFGPANGAISERAVVDAAKEANPKGYARLLVIAFAIEPAARQTVARSEETLGIPATYAQATTDLVMSDLLKNTRSSQIFAIVGLPDIDLEKLPEKGGDGEDLWQVTLNGLDTFNPATMEPASRRGDDVPCWMLDTDYDGQCFRAGQIFFPRTSAWDKIRHAVRADFADSVWEALRGNISAPFIAGEQIAVKVLDDRGNELLVVRKVEK